MTRLAIVLLLPLLLAGCGGKTVAPSAPPIPPMPREAPLLLAYYGLSKGRDEIKELVAQGVNAIHVPDWGPFDTAREAIAQRIIADLTAARELGIQNVILGTGFLTFTSSYQWRGTADLVAFKARLGSLADLVCATYPVDEPDMLGISDAVMTICYRETKAVFQVPTAVIYGDHGTPGIAAANWVGRNDYPAGISVLSKLPAIRADQRRIIVPGGADPWRQDPAPFMAYAKAHNEVAWVAPFCWFDSYGGTNQKGIRSNGMADAYRAAYKVALG